MLKNKNLVLQNNTYVKTAVVIGSGFGGLSMAIRLQKLGFKTIILEKQSNVGGHASQFIEKGYTFDMGPSLITEPKILDRVFTFAGKKMSDYLQLIYLDPFYRVYFHDKTYIDYTGDSKKMKAELAKFNKQDANNYDSFIAYTKNLYTEVITNGLGATPFLHLKDFVSFIPKAFRLNAMLPAYFNVCRYFKDFRSRFMFSFHTLFIGGNPFTTPSIFLMLPYLEKSEGVWFCKGGMYTLVKAFENVFLSLGGKILTNCEVTHLNIDANKNIKSVTYKHVKNNNVDTIECDLVVSNASFAHTYLDLIDNKYKNKWTNKKVTSLKYSMSCVLLYIGVKAKYPNLKHHTLILSKRYKDLVTEIFKGTTLPKDFSMYLHVPSITDSFMAPKGCESMYLLMPVPNLKHFIDWENVKNEYAKKVLNFLEFDFGLSNLQKNIEVLKIYTPLDFLNDRNNYLGACWSLQPTLFQIASFRPKNKSEDINNLYLVGASTHPGPGVPGVVLSAEATQKVIENDFYDYIKARI